MPSLYCRYGDADSVSQMRLVRPQRIHCSGKLKVAVATGAVLLVTLIIIIVAVMLTRQTTKCTNNHYFTLFHVNAQI